MDMAQHMLFGTHVDAQTSACTIACLGRSIFPQNLTNDLTGVIELFRNDLSGQPREQDNDVWGIVHLDGGLSRTLGNCLYLGAPKNPKKISQLLDKMGVSIANQFEVKTTVGATGEVAAGIRANNRNFLRALRNEFANANEFFVISRNVLELDIELAGLEEVALTHWAEETIVEQMLAKNIGTKVAILDALTRKSIEEGGCTGEPNVQTVNNMYSQN